MDTLSAIEVIPSARTLSDLLLHSAPDPYQVGDSVILRNGYCGTIKYIHHESNTYGIELTKPHFNGHDGKNCFKCKPHHGILTGKEFIVSKLSKDGTYFDKTLNETISFPTNIEIKQIRKKQKALTIFGYIRRIHKTINNGFFKIIPHDIIQLCIEYDSYHPQNGDHILLKSGQDTRLWSIGYSSKSKRFYFGIVSIKVITVRLNEGEWMNFVPEQEVRNIKPIDYSFQAR